jgi:hypothetical protein
MCALLAYDGEVRGYKLAYEINSSGILGGQLSRLLKV